MQRKFFSDDIYMPPEGEFLFNHSRSGIMIALEASDLPKDAGVGVMVYNCHTVMNAVEQAGCKPVFIDVTDELKLDLEDLARKVNELSAIVVTHLFGVVNDVKSIKEAYPNLIIIEDCAHAYGIEELHGAFATFSIGQGKLPSIGDGGILKVLNDKYRDKVVSLYEALSEYTKLQSAKLFVKLWVKSVMQSRLVYGWLTLPMKKHRGAPLGREVNSPKKMYKGISSILVKKKEDVPKMIILRKNNARKLMSQLPEGVSRALVGQNAFMLVLYCDNLGKVRQYYHRQGVEAETHFVNSIRWAEEFGYNLGQCPNAEKLVNHLLMVPTYFDKQ